MSLTSPTVTSTWTSPVPSTTTPDPLRPLIAPDAVRFLIIAATMAVFFGSITCVCCLTHRIRKANMRRIVVAAFEQGAFDREFVHGRVAYMHRGDPTFSRMFPTSRSGNPQYHDRLGRPYGNGNVDFDANVDHVSQPVEAVFFPLSAQVQVAPVAQPELQPRPHLSSLPLEKQLALLFHASQSKEERTRRRLEHRYATDPLLETQREPELVLSVLITMPRARQLPKGSDGELAFGTTGFRWHYGVVEPGSHATAALSNENAVLVATRV